MRTSSGNPIPSGPDEFTQNLLDNKQRTEAMHTRRDPRLTPQPLCRTPPRFRADGRLESCHYADRWGEIDPGSPRLLLFAQGNPLHRPIVPHGMWSRARARRKGKMIPVRREIDEHSDTEPQQTTVT